MRERRRHVRVQLVAPVKVYDMVADKAHDGMIVNVSQGGLGIRLPVTLAMQTPVALEFVLPQKRTARHVQAHVVRSHRVIGTGGSLVGVAFYRAGRELEDELEAFVSRHRRLAAGRVDEHRVE